MADVPEEVTSALADPRVRRAGRYVLLAELGRGGMGAVYRAWDPEMQRLVALKVLLDTENEQGNERFVREALSAGKLRHPGIIAVFDTGKHGKTPFIVMELIDGESFHGRLKRPIEPREVARIVRDIALAVAFAHKSGVVHRDLKPGNVLLDREGGIHLADFGLVRVSGAKSLTMTGQVLGTPGYMAPEQAAGEKQRHGPASDVYSLGAIIYKAITGETPFQDQGVAQILFTDPVAPLEINPKADRRLAAIAMRCLAKDPEARPTATALADELDRLVRSSGGGGRRVTRVVAALLVLAGGGSGAFAALSARGAPPLAPPRPAPPALAPAAPPPAPPKPPPAPPAKPPGDSLEERLVARDCFAVSATGVLSRVGDAPRFTGTRAEERPGSLALDTKHHRLFLGTVYRVFAYQLDDDNVLQEGNPISVLGQEDFEPKDHEPAGDKGPHLASALFYDAEKDRLLVVDLARNKVLIYGTENLPRFHVNPLYAIGGVKPGGAYALGGWETWGHEFSVQGPTGALIHGGLYYVASAGHDKVNVYERDEIERRIAKPAHAQPTGIMRPVADPAAVAASSKWLFVASNGESCVLVFELPGSRPSVARIGDGGKDPATRTNLHGPSSLAVDERRGVLYVADAEHHRVVEYDIRGLPAKCPARFVYGQPDFESGETAQGDLLSDPRSLAVDTQSGRLYVADARTMAISVLAPKSP